MRNFNEKVTPPTEVEADGVAGGNPHKLYNNFSNLG